jgi:hypothetical protein
MGIAGAAQVTEVTRCRRAVMLNLVARLVLATLVLGIIKIAAA